MKVERLVLKEDDFRILSNNQNKALFNELDKNLKSQ